MKPLMHILRRFAREHGGAAALEFAMVAPVFIMLVVGGIAAGNAVFEVASMHYAVESGARCASIQTTVCTSSSAVVTYTQSHYAGPRLPAPTFTYSTAGCGHTVTGTVTYSMNIGTKTYNIPVSTAACYP
jgi:Flp pilus assembly protein TadG